MARPHSIGELLPAALRESGMEKPIIEVQIVDRWPEMMGPVIARMTRSVEVEDGVLRIKLSNAALRAQFFEQRHELIQRINDQFGGKVIHDVRLL